MYGWFSNSFKYGKKNGIFNGITAFSIALVLILGSILVIIPQDARAETKPGGTLKNDQPARTYTTGWWWTGTPDELQFKIPTKTDYYTAVAIENRQSGEDFDLFTYNDYDMENLIASSTKGSNEIDLVVIDGHTYSGGYKYGKVYKFTGSDWNSGIRIESDYHCVADDLHGSDPDSNGYLTVGDYRYSMFEYHGTSTYSGTLRGDYPLVNMYDIYLDAGGEYDFEIDSIPSSEQLAMYLFKGSGNINDALVSDSNSAGGGSLSFSYDPESSGYYGLCVVDLDNGYSSSNNYTMLITSDFEMSSEPTSSLIAPGMNASFEVDVKSLGITKDIDLHYRWEDNSGNMSTPSGATASLNIDTVNTGGVGTETAYLNVSTTSSMSAGTYYLTVYGNDTGQDGGTKSTTVTLKVSTNPDFFLEATPELRAISPGTSARYSVDMETINSFSDNVTMTASSSPSHSSLNFSFSPKKINSSNPTTNLTVSTTSSTPIGKYEITIKGNTSTLTRYSNVTLRIKEPISIDLIAPGPSEIVAGVYTFKARAGSPPDTDSVEITFGGKMSSLGTLNMYYNSGTGFWERTVNTYSVNDGFCWINLTAIDFAGGLTKLGPKNFTLSNSAPNPIINTPMDRSYVTGTSMPISVNTTSHVISVRFRVDQNAWTSMARSGNTWTGDWDTTQITDGEHTLTVEAKDSAGLTGESTVTIFVDNNKPSCTINSPIDGQYIEGSYTFRVVATDTVGVNHVDIRIFGDNTTLPYNPITSSYEYTVTTSTKADGTYAAMATAYDNVNQSKKSEEITFYIDNNDPSLSINSPQDGEIVGGDYNISVTSSDTYLNSVKYKIDSTGWRNMTGTEPNWNKLINTSELTDGSHMLYVKTTDNSSHVTQQAIEFVVDNTKPSCSLVSPFPGAYIEGVYNFQVSASDSVGIDRVTLSVFTDTVQTTFNKQTGYYENAINTLTVSDGIYQLVATAYDSSGKETKSTMIDFRVDNNAPEMSVNNIQNGDYVNGSFRFNVTVDDAFLKEVHYAVDGGSWVDIDDVWNTGEVLDGDHKVTFRAKDNAGHTTIQSVDLIVDNNLPVCAVNGPVNGEFIQEAYSFRLSASDSVGIDRVEIHVFGSNFSAIYSSTSGYFEFNSDTSIRKDGNYTCYAIAHDKSGKINVSESVHFQVDNNAPVIRINHPQPESYLEEIEIMDVNATDIFLDTVEYNLDGTGWVPINQSLNTTRFSDGDHTLMVRAKDKAGHMTQQVLDVTIDNTDPYGAISSPVSGQFLSGSPLFQIVASDIVGIRDVKIDIFGSEKDMNYNSGSGYYEYRTDTTLIPDGKYSFNVSVDDLSGKSRLLGPRMFRVDNHAPDLEVYNVNKNDIISGELMIDWMANDTFLDAVQYQVDTTGWVNISTPLNTSAYEDGDHTLTIRAVDLSDKRAVESYPVKIDNIGPTCTINSPVDGEFVEGVVTIRVTAFDIVGIDYVMIKVYDIEARVPYNAQTGYYEYSSNTITWGAGEDGVRNVTATAYDLTGKMFTYGPVDFNVDNRDPTINIYSPKEGDVVSGLFFFDVKNGDVFKKGTDYNIDGASWQPVSIGWDTTLVPDGWHEVTIRATDKAGHLTFETMNVRVDNHAPEITISGPSDGEFVDTTYTFRIAASDEVGITSVNLHIDGSTRILSYNTQTGYYEYMLDTRSLEDGTYVINATATDVAKRSVTSDSVTFYVDNNAPELVVESPVKDELISGTFVLRAQSDDEFPLPVLYSIDGTTWFELRKTPWNTTKVLDGPHTVTIRARDQAGHFTEFDVRVTVDNTDPVISQSTLTPGQKLSGIQTLRFYVYDSIGIRQVEMSIDEASPFEIFRGEGGLYYEYMLDTRTLGDRSHNISVRAIDRAGNTYDTQYGIRTDNSGPEIELDYYWIEGSEQVRLGSVEAGNSVVFVANVTDPSGVETVMINIDSSGWREMAPDSNESNPNSYVLFWPTGESEGGAHVFQIRTSDELGNEAERSGLINVERIEEDTTFIEAFTDALPVLWFILIIILIIAIGILAYTGVLTTWARGEGMNRDNEKGEEEEPKKERKVKNPFRKKQTDDGVSWDKEDKE